MRMSVVRVQLSWRNAVRAILAVGASVCPLAAPFAFAQTESGDPPGGVVIKRIVTGESAPVPIEQPQPLEPATPQAAVSPESPTPAPQPTEARKPLPAEMPDGPTIATDQDDAPSPVLEPLATFATKIDEPSPQPAEKIGAAEFNGVRPGETMSDQLDRLWGVGKTIAEEGDVRVQTYALPDFPRVDVSIDKNVVKSVIIHLETPLPPKALAEKLEVNDVRPVNVPDENGAVLGQLFPEHGVLFNLTPDGRRVLHVALEPIDVNAFLLRAEATHTTHCRAALADAGFVLSKQPGNARALFLRAKILRQFGHDEEALIAAQAALVAEPANPEFRLCRAEVLGAIGRYDEAAQAIQEVLDGDDAPGQFRARALCLLGDLLAASPAHDHKQAMEHHLAAIQIADPLSIDRSAAVRRAAKLVLIDAHLAVANDIASSRFQQKERVVPKWLARASAYVQDTIDSEDGDPALRLKLAHRALTACAATGGVVDPEPWMRTAIQKGKELIATADDPWRKSRLQWQLGLAMAEGAAADEARGITKHALPNATLTASYLEAGAKDRHGSPDDVFQLGRLYYRIGSLHAVQRSDHKTAVSWYEKAVPLLDRPLPATSRDQQGRYGEWLVSMGISYWETGDKDYAVQLTDAGVRHVEEAVARQLLGREALGVPYNNLAAMHEALGHTSEAKSFSELATKAQDGIRR